MKPLTIAGVRLIDDGDRIVSSVRSGKPFEPKSLAAWAGICSAGGRILDIGSYTGLYAILAAKKGCRAIAFEPLTQNRGRMLANAALNGVSININSEAVSDKVGRTTIIVNPHVTGLTSGASLLKQKGQAVAVSTVTVDSLNLTTLTAMKVDVERAEPQVLAGARETLKRCRPVLLIEVLDEERAKGVRAALKGLKYGKPKVLDERNWLLVPK